MKKISTLIICLLAASSLFGQDCSNYVYMKKGKTLELKAFNGAGNFMYKVVDFVSDVVTSDGTTTATVKSQSFDANGNSKGPRIVSYKCTGGAFSMDLSANAPQSGAVKMSTTYMEYPRIMNVGDHFPDATAQWQMIMGSHTLNIVIKITNRTVVDKESVTTPAGTWDAFKITYDTVGMGRQSVQSTQWFVPGFGIVQLKIDDMTLKLTSVH